MLRLIIVVCLIISCENSKLNNSNKESDSLFIFQSGQDSTPLALGDEWVNTITVDDNNNSYLAGVTSSDLDGSHLLDDILVIKLDSKGQKKWLKQVSTNSSFNTSGSERIRTSQIIGSYLYLIGETTGDLFETNSGSTDIILLKMDLNGNIIWTKQYGLETIGSGANKAEECYDSTTDKNGKLYLLCTTKGNFADTNGGSNTNDFLVINVDTNNGEVNWSYQFGASVANSTHILSTSKNEIIGGIKADDENLYIAGSSKSNFVSTNSGGVTYGDAVIISLNKESQVINWVKQLNNTELGSNKANSDDAIYNVAISKTSIYLFGSTAGILGESSQGNSDCYIVKMNKESGANILINQLTGNSPGADNNCRGYTDSKNNIYLVATTYSNTKFGTLGGYSDGFIAYFDKNLNNLWGIQLGSNIQTINSNSSYGDYLWHGVIDKNGNFIAGGGTYGSFKEPANALDSTADLLVIKINNQGKLNY